MTIVLKKLQRLHFFLQLGIVSFLAVGLSHLWVPGASAQLPNLWDLNSNSNQQPSIQYIKRGNIHIADVRLDGVPLFKVAAAAEKDQVGDRRNILPIEWRVNEIETRLNKIVSSNFDPKALQVTISTLNNQTVIVVAGREWEQSLMTVTELDRQIDSTANPLSDIAEMRAEAIETALLKAHGERQPEYLQQQFSYFLVGLLGVVVSSLLMQQLQKRLKRHWRTLHQSAPGESSPEMTENDTDNAIAASSTDTLPRNPLSRWRLLHCLRRWQWPQLSLSQQRNINLILRFCLWWSQLCLWLVGAIIALLLFPQTRGAGVWLLLVPIKFVTILLGLSISKKMLDILVVYGLGKWAEQDTSLPSIDRRIALRLPVITQLYQEVMHYVVIGAGILLFLYSIQAPLTLVITSLAVVGFGAQNLIKDWIGGLLILWEDQYIQGDVVRINNIARVVESLRLRTTQLRTLDGELVTIANGSFTTAINLTHQWSQLNLGIDVAYATDLDRAMTVISEVAEKMRCDPVWGPLILEPATILGVDAFGESSITIRLLIKTQPMKQWDVGREYRHRLKQAFDLAEITIPFPQRSIWVEGVPT